MDEHEEMEYNDDMGFAYSLASGRLFCPFDVFQERCEKLLGRPLWTHEFARKELIEEMQDAFEEMALEALDGRMPTRRSSDAPRT